MFWHFRQTKRRGLAGGAGRKAVSANREAAIHEVATTQPPAADPTRWQFMLLALDSSRPDWALRYRRGVVCSVS